jgi:chitinase
MKTFYLKIKSALGIIFLLMAFNAHAQTKVIGYLPTWMSFPTSVNNIDLTKVTHINIAFANPSSSGVLTGVSSSDVAYVVNAAHAKNVKVSISIGGAGAPASTYKTLLSSSTNRTNFVNNLVAYTTNNNLDGIDVDIEGDVLDGSNVTASQYQSFVTELATALHAQNKIMTAALATWFADYVTNTAASKFDWINIMSYDGAIPGSGDAAGPHATYAMATNDFNYWNTTKGVPGLKLTVGLPFYGYGWGTYATADNDEISYATIVSTYAGAETKDQIGSGSNAIYYNGIPTIQQKTTFAKQNGGGVMIWELAEDATGSKSLLLAIDQIMHPTTNVAPSVSITAPANGTNVNTGATVTINATASDSDGTVTKVEFFIDGTKIGEDTGSPYTYNWTAASGTHSITAKATDNGGAVKTSSAVSITVTTSSSQAPYGGTAASIPGKIEAENYDTGGQGVAYNDLTAGNSGNAYRTDDVDVQATTDTGGGYNIGWVQAGEWVEYTVNVTTASKYTLSARVAATATGKTFHVELDGVNISGAISIPNTGAYQTFSTVTVTTPSLTTGQKILRIVMDSPSFNLNYISFAAIASSGNLALNKPATASSLETSSFPASAAVDGSGATRWASAYSDPQWIYVDLGASYNVSRVKITWEAAYASAYQIQVSSTTSTWTTIKSVSGNSALVNDNTGLSGTGRYVRINGTSRGTVYGYSIFELEVYGTPSGARLVSETPESASQERLVSAYPNPANEHVTIQSGAFWLNANISLHNSAGQPLVTEKIKGEDHTFDLSNLPQGLYLINISNATHHTAVKILRK